MKKLLSILVLIISASAFAKTYTGKVTNVIADDEGKKVVIGNMFMLYSSKAKAQHADVTEKAEAALVSQKTVFIEASEDTEIISIKVQN